jgi:hypothetical protein
MGQRSSQAAFILHILPTDASLISGIFGFHEMNAADDAMLVTGSYQPLFSQCHWSADILVRPYGGQCQG